MGLRDDQTALARRALLEAARTVFEREGYDGASIRAIASQAGMSTGAVFNYATSKLDLLHQVLHEHLEEACQRAVDAPRQGTVVDQLAAVAQPLFEAFAERPDLSRTLLQHSLMARGDAGAAFREQVERVAAAAGERIAAADPSLPVERLVLAFLSAYYFALIVSLSADAPEAEGALQQFRATLDVVDWSPR